MNTKTDDELRFHAFQILYSLQREGPQLVLWPDVPPSAYNIAYKNTTVATAELRNNGSSKYVYAVSGGQVIRFAEEMGYERAGTPGGLQGLKVEMSGQGGWKMLRETRTGSMAEYRRNHAEEIVLDYIRHLHKKDGSWTLERIAPSRLPCTQGYKRDKETGYHHPIGNEAHWCGRQIRAEFPKAKILNPWVAT